MTPERHERISALYCEALDLQESERAAFLGHACGEDQELLNEIQSLLDSHREVGGYFSVAAMDLAAQLLAEERQRNARGSLVGQRLKHFEFISPITDETGDVYRALDHKIGCHIAVKVLSPEFAADPERVARFDLEARRLSRLNHPNIAITYAVHEEDGQYIVVRELVKGETLADRIRRGPLPANEAIAIAKQVADALEAAHRIGLVHHDLRPANIKITHDGRIKIVDFGLDQVTQDDDARPHVWAFGCLLFEMLTQKRPFEGRSVAEMLAAVMSGTPDWSALDTTSTPLRSMIQCCLDEEETRRFNSISEARAALDNLSGRVRPRSRSRFVAVVIAIAIVMSIGLGYMGIRMLSTPDIPWIGVLPMRSVDGTADSLANSTTEELTAALGQLGPNVRVKSFSAMRSYRESEKPISAIAQELGVNYLLEGSVQQSETGIVVKASLVAANDTPLWSNTYRRDDADVLTLQRELVRDIAAEIRVKPALEHEHAPVRVVPAAYQTYRAGVDKSRSSEPQALLASVDLFKEAIRIDPNFAAPHAALARVHADMGFASIMPPGDAYPLAGMEAQEALALDPTNEDATLTRIRIRVDHDWDFVKAESEYMELIGKNPNNTDAYGFYSQLLVALGRTEEALAMNKRTLEFDPRSMESAYRESWIQYMARRPDASIAGWQKVQAAFPSPQLGLAQLGDAYALVGRNEDAFIHYQQALRSGEADPSRITTLDAAYGSGGLNGYLRKLLEVHEIHTYDRASLHARLGDKKDAIAWLIKAYEERHNRMIFIKVDPAFDAIREEPEFLQLIKKVGLTP